MKTLPLSRLTESKFPKWNDGDVIIWLSPNHEYQLHAAILRERSDYFRNILVEKTALVMGSSSSDSEPTLLWSLELVLPGSDQDKNAVGHFQEIDCKEREFGNCKQTTGCADTKLFSSLYQHYDNIFRAYYDKPLILQDESMPLIVQDIIGLVHVAERLGSTRVVAAGAANAIIQQGQILFRSIAASPLLWADLGIRIRSDLIFKESIIHLVGQWPRLKDDIPPQMCDFIRILCEKKHEQLQKTKSVVELRILGYYPTKIQRINAPLSNPAATGRGFGGRGGGNRTTGTRMQSYAADIFLWMALNLFRHWMGQAICTDKTRNSIDGGFQFYKAIATADRSSYIDKDDIDSFCNRFPLSPKGRDAFEDRIIQLKEAISRYVDDLMVNNSQLDIKQWPVDYLTCCCVEKSDLPWLRNERK